MAVFVKSLHLLVVPGLPCTHVLVARENVRLLVLKVQKLLNLLANYNSQNILGIKNLCLIVSIMTSTYVAAFNFNNKKST